MKKLLFLILLSLARDSRAAPVVDFTVPPGLLSGCEPISRELAAAYTARAWMKPYFWTRIIIIEGLRIPQTMLTQAEKLNRDLNLTNDQFRVTIQAVIPAVQADPKNAALLRECQRALAIPKRTDPNLVDSLTCHAICAVEWPDQHGRLALWVYDPYFGTYWVTRPGDKHVAHLKAHPALLVAMIYGDTFQKAYYRR
jgi:hypothetical protein